VLAIRRQQAHNLLMGQKQLNSVIMAQFIGNSSKFMIDIIERYKTKGEKLLDTKAEKPNSQNQASKVIIYCTNIFDN